MTKFTTPRSRCNKQNKDSPICQSNLIFALRAGMKKYFCFNKIRIQFGGEIGFHRNGFE